MNTREGFLTHIEPVVPPKTRYLKEREVAFVELLDIFKNITDGKEFVLRLPDAAKKYSQFLAVSDREPLISAVDDWNKNFLNPDEKRGAWAKILSVVMSSGVNRCDVESPGLREVKRLIPLSPFKNNDVVAHVTAFAIISPNEVLQPSAHHKHYWRVRRMVYHAAMTGHSTAKADILMGAEYFITGKLNNSVLWESGYEYNPYALEVAKPIDRRG